MKTSNLLIAVSLFVTTVSASVAGPGPQYWQQRRAERGRAAAVTPVETRKATESCCRVVTVQRPIASHKVTIPVQAVECSSCAPMAAGEKCPMSS